MPIYEYECKACGKRVERLIRSPADVPSRCPACGVRPLRKAFSAFSVGRASAPAAGAACGTACEDGSCPYSGGTCDGCDD